MADNTIDSSVVEIRGDISNLQAALAAATGYIKDFNDNVVAVSRQLTTFNREVSGAPVRQMSDALREANRPLRDLSIGMGILATAGVAAGKTVIDIFAEFEQKIANIQAVADATTSEMVEISTAAREFGKTTIFSAAQAADGMTELAKAGFNARQTIDAARGALALAAATGESFAGVTDIMVGALNSFSLAAEDSDRVANVYAAAIAKSQATTDRLRDSMKFVGSIANSVNVPIEQVVATLSLLFNAGFQASTAGTALRQVFLRLQAPTKQTREALAELGLSLQSVNPQKNNLIEILQAFKKVGADAIDKGDELSRIFGERAVSAFQVLIRQGAPALASLQARITGTDDATKQAAIQIDTFKGSVRLLTGQLQETALQLGSILVPVIRIVVNVIRDTVAGFNELPTVVKTATVAFGGLTTVLLAVGTPLVFVASQIPFMIDGIVKLRVALGTAFPVITAITLGIIALGAAFLVYGNHQRRAREENQNAIKAISSQIETRGRELERINTLANAYITLAETEGETAEKNKELAKISGDLNSIYPGLISNTRSFAGNLDQVKRAAFESAAGMKRLLEEKQKFEEIAATLELVDFQRGLREADKSLREMNGKAEKMFSTFIGFDKPTAEFINTLKSGKVFAQQMADNLDNAADNTSSINLAALENGLKASLLTTKNTSDFFGDIASLTEQITRNELKILDIEKNKQTLTEQQYKNYLAQNNLSVGESNLLQSRNERLQDVLGIYVKIAGQLKNVEEFNVKIAESEQKLKALKERGAAKSFSPGFDLPDIDLGEPDDTKDQDKAEKAEKDRREKMLALARQIEDKKRDAALEAARIVDQDTLSGRLRSITAEFEARKAILDAEKAEELIKLAEIGDDRLAKVREQSSRELAAKIIGIEAARRQEIAAAQTTEEIDAVERKFLKQAEIATEAQREQLAIAQRESTDKIAIEEAYSAKLQALRDQRNADTIEAQEKDSNLQLDLSLARLEHEYETEELSAEQYRFALQKKLEDAELWSEAYITILRKIDDVDRQIGQARERQAKITADNIVKTFSIVQGAFEKSSKGMTGAWKDALKDVVDLFANHYVAILSMSLQKALGVGNFAQAANAAARIVAVKTIQSIANNQIDQARVGADIMADGVVQVHRGETIVPARIVRATRKTLQKTASGAEGALVEQNGPNQNAGLNGRGNLVIEKIEIHNPIVGDQDYWNTVVERHLGEAIYKLNDQRRSNA